MNVLISSRGARGLAKRRRGFGITGRLLSVWDSFESSHGTKIEALPEVGAVQDLLSFLKQQGGDKNPAPCTAGTSYNNTLTKTEYLLALDAAMATFSLHVHARIASLVGKGFYTIGPCGEELLSASAFALEEEDTSALHYRHTGISIARQLLKKPMDDVLLARARGYAVSKHDPVTGGVHCSIGGGPNEFLVTSTLVRRN